MKRDIVIHREQGGDTAAVLGVAEEREQELISFVCDRLAAGTNMADLVLALNDRGDLNDNEWVYVLFALGMMCGSGDIHTQQGDN